jgi:hypothetical protein
MEILKKGDPRKVSRERKFSCERYWCVFVARKMEYEGASQMEWLDQHVSFKCKCPICGNMVYQ